MTETELSIETMSRSGAAAVQTVYASFGLGAQEYALDVKYVSEVVNLPSSVAPMPLAPDFLLGIFNLRGAIIPMLDARRLLGAGALEAPASDAKVVVVEHCGVRLGLLVDKTGRVLRPRAEEQVVFTYEDSSPHRVVKGVLKIGDALIRVLDLDRLITLEDVPHGMSNMAGVGRAKLQRRRCIIFRVGQMRLAFPINGIDEIVLALGQARVGMLVDAVESIEAYADDELLYVPAVSQHKASMFLGCLDLGERGHVLVLDSAGVLDNHELARITGNFSTLFTAKEETAVRRQRVEQRQPFLWFTARDAFALPMPAVREIIDCSSELIAMPGAADYVAGMVDLRGTLVTVIDVRAFYRLDGGDSAPVQPELRRIVILDQGDMLLGLLVDSVQSIARVDAADRIPVPHLMRNSMPEAQRKDVTEIIHVTADEQTVHLRVLDPARIFAAVSAPLLEAHV